MISATLKKVKLVNEFYFYRTALQISSYFAYSFYLILLYRQTADLTLLAIDSIVFYVSMWMGYVFGSFIIQRLGYVNTFRLSFFLTALSALAIAISIGHIGQVFVLLTLLRGFARGVFWSINNIYLLKEFNESQRGSVISLIISIILIFDIIFPPIIGLIIGNGENYYLIYIIAFVVCIATLFARFDYNKKPETKITSDEIVRILRNVNSDKFFLLTLIDNSFKILLEFTLLILPFLFLQSESGVGALLSGVSLLCAFIAFTQRKAKLKSEYRLAKLGYLIFPLGSLFLATQWNNFGLGIYMVCLAFYLAISRPYELKVDVKLRERILGKDRSQSSVEMNLVIETVYLIARVIGFAIFFILFTGGDYQNVFKVFILIASIWFFIYIIFLRRMLNQKDLFKQL